VKNKQKGFGKEQLFKGMVVAVVLITMICNGLVAYRVSVISEMVDNLYRKLVAQGIIPNEGSEIISGGTCPVPGWNNTNQQNQQPTQTEWKSDCGKELTDDYDVVVVYRPGCSNCRRTKPLLESTDAKIYWVWVDECPEFIRQNYIEELPFTLPLVHCLRNDQIHTGLFRSKDEFNSWMNSCLSAVQET